VFYGMASGQDGLGSPALARHSVPSVPCAGDLARYLATRSRRCTIRERLREGRLTLGIPLGYDVRRRGKEIEPQTSGKTMNATTERDIIVRGRDTWSEAHLDRIEAAAKGKIIWVSDDGCGNTRLVVRPNVRYLKAERKAILKAVQEIAPSACWEAR
jgi:hypothetical protein